MDKGAIEIQFNWIFVIIAGAIILLFFIGIINKQKQVSDLQISAIISGDLDAIFTGAKISTGTVNIIDIPRGVVEFECNKYRVGGVSKDIVDKIVFTPDLIKGNKMITWALRWDVPYKATNFLFLTSPQVRYVIINESSFAKDMLDMLPDEEFNKDGKRTTDEIKDLNNYRVRFVFFDQEPVDSMLAKLDGMKDSHVTAINVIKDINSLEKGTIKFYQKNDDVWEFSGDSVYLKKESVIGAIYSSDVLMYNCSMQKAFKKLNLVNHIYKERSIKLDSFYGADSCAAIHQDAIIRLTTIEAKSQEFNKDNVEDIYYAGYGATDGLERLNGNSQLYSCINIY